MIRLLTPCTVGALPLRNHVVVPPMTTRLSAADGVLSPREQAFWMARARGGAAMVIVGPFVASTELESSRGLLRLDDDRFVEPVRRTVEALHGLGAAVGAQLTPGQGRLAEDSSRPVSASAVTTPQGRVCRALAPEEIDELIEEFGAAAARAVAAGIDLIDIDARAGGLVDQFLTAVWNRRTDRWGGDRAGRARLLLALVAAVREAGGPDVPVSVRLSLDHHLPGGRELTESIQIATWLGEAGVDLVIAEEGSPLTPYLEAPDFRQPMGAHLAAAAQLRREAHVMVMVAGATTPQQAADAIEAGEIDLVGFGRAHIAEPDLVSNLEHGRRNRPCVRGNSCLDAVRSGKPLRCDVNALAGSETGIVLTRAARPRRVVVVGGGPAGMEAARVAAQRGHVVDLYEAREHLGGIPARTGRPGFKSEMLALVSWYRAELADLGVTIHLERTVRIGSSVLAGADAVVLATGARPVRPEITGIDRPDVCDVLDVCAANLGRRVVIIGGGVSGADTALDLARLGHEVTLVEAGDEIAPGSPEVARSALLAALAEVQVRMLTGTSVHTIDDLGVRARGPEGPVRMDADSVVLAVGLLPSRELVAGGVLEDPGVHLVGDCSSPGTLGQAIRAGFTAALNL